MLAPLTGLHAADPANIDLAHRTGKKYTALNSRRKVACVSRGSPVCQLLQAAFLIPKASKTVTVLVWITRDHDCGGGGEILFARFTEEEVPAGKDVSGKIRLKQVVNMLVKPLPEEASESGNKPH